MGSFPAPTRMDETMNELKDQIKEMFDRIGAVNEHCSIGGEGCPGCPYQNIEAWCTVQLRREKEQLLAKCYQLIFNPESNKPPQNNE